MKTRQLEALVALVECGTVNAAADRLNTPQPNLSRILKTLEAEYSSKIFNRSDNRLHVTPLGMTLFRRAKSVVAEIEAARADLDAFDERGIETVRLSCAPIALEHLLPTAISRLQQDAFEFSVVLIGTSEDDPDSRIRALRDGSCDIVVTLADDVTDKSGLQQQNLFDLELRLFTSKAHPALSLAEPTLQSLFEFDWVLQSRNGVPAGTISRSFKRAEIAPPSKSLLVSDRYVISLLLAKGQYISPLLYHPDCVSDPLVELDQVQIAGYGAKYQLALFTRTGYLPNIAAKQMIRELVDNTRCKQTRRVC